MIDTQELRHAASERALGRFGAAYEALRHEIEAATPRVVNVEWPHVARVVGRALQGAAPYRHRLAGLAHELELARIVRLPVALDAFIYTSARCLPPSRVEARRALQGEAISLRRRMLADLHALSLRGLPGRRLPRLSMESGYAELAGDLFKLAGRIDDVALAGHVLMVSAEERARAEPLALALIEACDHRTEARNAARHARLVRQKAFALVTSSYEELRSALLFLWRNEPALGERWVPPLARVPGRGAPKTKARG